ncbi:MAG: amino acid ABC transporter permease [Pseudomonadota bacterium]
MSDSSGLAATAGQAHTAWYNDERKRAVFFQILVLLGVIALIAFFAYNAVVNLAERGIASGFGFLSATAGYGISFTLIPYQESDTHGYAFLVGLLNTVLVSFLGIIAATIIGFILGVLRLSKNWMVNKVAYSYVEIVRNTPLLLQIIFWWSLFLNLPIVRQALDLGGGFYLSNRGVQAPTPILEAGWQATPIAHLIGIIATMILKRWAKARQAQTGQTFPVGWAGLGLIVGMPVAVFLASGIPVTMQNPVLGGFNFRGGFNIPPEFFALWFALTIYTAGFIAEIVRAGIQAVSYGQTEAASALGLSDNRTLRLVVIPQAMRVIMPPLTSQYLNLTKNSSLAVAIGYPDLVSITAGTTLNQTGQAIEAISMTMAVYLTLSLLISLIMNAYNRRIALVER